MPVKIKSTLLAASVSINPLEHNISRDSIVCPGDTLSYNCSIKSNSETLHLTWHVTAPEQMPVNITYFNHTDDIESLNNYITTTVTDFSRDEFIHSTLEIRIQEGISIDQIVLECSIGVLGDDNTTVLINTSSKYLQLSQ